MTFYESKFAKVFCFVLIKSVQPTFGDLLPKIFYNSVNQLWFRNVRATMLITGWHPGSIFLLEPIHLALGVQRRMGHGMPGLRLQTRASEPAKNPVICKVNILDTNIKVCWSKDGWAMEWPAYAYK